MFIIKFFKITFYLGLLTFIAGATVAYFMGVMPTSIGIHSEMYKASNIALDGYDIVNYHFMKKTNKGDVRFNYKYKDINWFFNSARNLKAFKAKPQRYVPKFGGYCTYTMSKGYTYPPDPSVWHLHKRRLYFFKDAESKKLALSDWENVLDKANSHWR
jgi:YHS domain-containing protein